MDFYKILLIVLIVFIVYFTYYQITGKSQNTLTAITKTDTPYVVTTDMIHAINPDSIQNYAISIWLYIDKWTVTSTAKSVLNIPNVLDISLEGSTNNLGVNVYYDGSTGGGIIVDPTIPPGPIIIDPTIPPGPIIIGDTGVAGLGNYSTYKLHSTMTITGPNVTYIYNSTTQVYVDSHGIVVFRVNSDGAIVDNAGTIAWTAATVLEIAGNPNPAIPETCPGDYVAGSNKQCCDEKISGIKGHYPVYNMKGMTPNNVYQNRDVRNEYTFVYSDKTDGTEWYKVEVWFVRPALIRTAEGTAITRDTLPSGYTPGTELNKTDNMSLGTPYDGFELEAHGQLPQPNSTSAFLVQTSWSADTPANQPPNCNFQTYSNRLYQCRATSGQCNDTTNKCESKNPPVIVLLNHQRNICNHLKATTVRMTDSQYYSRPYFNPDGSYTDIPYFQFVYYSTSTDAPIIQPPQPMISGAPIVSENFTNNNNPNYINMLYTPSSLFGGSGSLYDNNLLSRLYKNTTEGIANPLTPFTGTVTNVPLQKWVNITVNISSNAFDIYMNGKLEQTYIIPGVPNPMGNTPITVGGPNSFVGWTSKLQYYPYSLNPQTIWNIYKEGFSKSPSIFSLLSQYSIKLIFVNNSSKNQVAV
jgi:hypothetical protein